MKKGWELRKVGEICDILSGFAFQSKDYVESSNTMNFRMSQIRPGGGIDLDNNPKYLPDSFGEIYKDYLLSNGDIVIAMTDMARATKILGVPTIVKVDNKKLLLNQRVGKFCKINQTKIFLPFLRYVLTSPQVNNYYKSLGRGGLQVNIGKYDILNARIPLPPVSEQQCIVAILDEAFEATATAKENAEKNLQNARDLFESYMERVFANPAKLWKKKKLGEVTEVKDGTHDSPSYIENGIPFITQKNIREIGLSFKDTKFISETDHKIFYKRSNVAFGDILISMIGANRGMACIVDNNKVFSIKNVGLIKPNETLNQQYLLYYLKSNSAAQYVAMMSNGGAQEFIGLAELRSFPIPMPSLPEQRLIVDRLDALSAETKKLEAIYQKN